MIEGEDTVGVGRIGCSQVDLITGLQVRVAIGAIPAGTATLKVEHQLVRLTLFDKEAILRTVRADGVTARSKSVPARLQTGEVRIGLLFGVNRRRVDRRRDIGHSGRFRLTAGNQRHQSDQCHGCKPGKNPS